MIDRDGDLWRRTEAGDWVLEPPPTTPGSGGKCTWAEITADFAPLTELPPVWYLQRTELLQAIRGSVVEMDDLLFHELGAHTVGTPIPGGWTVDASPDRDIVSRAQEWAARLRAQADALDTALRQATLLTEPPTDNSA